MLKKTLQWVLEGMGSLTLGGICEIITLKDGEEYKTRPSPVFPRQLLRLCSNFLRYSALDDRVETAHYTVREYFETLPADDYFCLQDDFSVYFGKSCLRYLLLPDYPVNHQTSPQVWEKFIAKRPFRKYAVQHWISHTTDESRAFRNEELLTLAETLFSGSTNSLFESFALDSYLADRKKPLLFENFSIVRSKVLEATPLHWASALWLWKLVEKLVEKDDASVKLLTPFGSPLYCAVDPSYKALAGQLDKHFPNDKCVAKTLKTLVAHRADVNEHYKRKGRSIVREALEKLPLSASEVLLGNNLICDRTAIGSLFARRFMSLIDSQKLDNHGISNIKGVTLFEKLTRKKMW